MTGKRALMWAPYILCAGAAGLIAAGALAGQTRDVWMKAVRVCLECIGIG